MTDIKPRWDEDGVPWCNEGCQNYYFDGEGRSCGIDGPGFEWDICHHAVNEMAQDKARLEGLLREVSAGAVSFEDHRVRWVEIQLDKETLRDIRAAIDAAMEEGQR